MSAASPSRIAVLALLAVASPAHGQPSPSRAVDACIAHVDEAASRSGLSAEIVLRVMMAESGGNAHIVSPKGAMGCMQIMPATWAYLSARYNLGADPFEARRNMIGGAMYLAELMARYGMTGAIAAYNAGPGRYERYGAGRAVLPAETIAYAARIGAVGGEQSDRPVVARWQEASLFVTKDRRADRSEPSTADSAETDRVPPNKLFPLSGSASSQANK